MAQDQSRGAAGSSQSMALMSLRINHDQWQHAQPEATSTSIDSNTLNLAITSNTLNLNQSRSSNSTMIYPRC